MAPPISLSFFAGIFAEVPFVDVLNTMLDDHGRFAVNLVMGWFTPEMFQGAQRAHDDRYRYGAEWLAVAKRLSTDEAPFDFGSAHFARSSRTRSLLFFLLQRGLAHRCHRSLHSLCDMTVALRGEFFVGILRLAGIGVAAAFLHYGSALADDITGAGSTFVSPVLSKWSATYSADGRSALAYQSVGSGGGIAALRSETVDFAATDAPLRPAELQKFGLVQFPLVVGGVVPIVNIEGVKPGEFRFTGSLLADIFLGKVTQWNDPKIVTLNPGVKLPPAAIIVAHRAEASGTTFNWANYLSKVSADWRDKVGEGLSVAWPIGVGGKGNDGVASFVKQTRNSIGYVEYAYALRSKLAYGLVQNKAGKFVPPGAKAFGAAAAGADWASAQNFYVVITDAAGEESYPIAATSFALMYKAPRVPTRTKAALDFFRWAFRDGQKLASDLGFVPLPANVVSQIEGYWKAQFADLD